MNAKTKRIAGLTVLFAALACAGLLISAAFIAKAADTQRALENMYQKSFYDLTANVGNIDVRLSKLMAAGSLETEKNTAAEIWRQANIAADNIAQLPLKHEEMSETVKFLNQTGDFGHSLCKKLNAGQTLTDADRKTVEDLQARCGRANAELLRVSEKLQGDWKISDHVDRGQAGRSGGAAFGDGWADLQIQSVDYPRMIYDGPFSDALEKKGYKAVEGAPEIGGEQAAERIRHILSDMNVSDVKFLGDANGDVETHEFEVRTQKGNYYVQMTVRGAFPVMAQSDRAVGAGKIDAGEAVRLAEKFAAEKLELKDMRGVWVNLFGGAATVNLAPEQDGAVIYPELVKVKVALDDGQITGVEARAYARGHGEDRTVPTARLTEGEALKKVSPRLDVSHIRKAVIPRDGGREALAYEFWASYKDFDYIVYINAETGAEEDILRVIDKNQGNMII
ncbi:MAG: germination protein YpeB [Clostridiales bacterium]|jgi:germination protein YpeB|nr:germination protein YpeB [Clostridiales bacterium]